MLRHIGATHRQIGSLLAWEGALVGALGAILGISLGFALALILIWVVNPQSFHWTMDVHVPWFSLAMIAVIMPTTAASAAVLAGRVALRQALPRTVMEDA